VITYSRHQVQRELTADQALWVRLSTALSTVLWPVEIALLGWGIGWWTGLLTVIALGIGSILLPSRLRINLYLTDLLDRLARLPLVVVWLLLIWHLTEREPIFTILGQPLVGALLVTVALALLTRPVALVSRFATRQIAGRLASRPHT